MKRAALFALLLSCGAQLSLAANVPIANAGFEDFVLTCTAGPFCNDSNVPGSNRLFDGRKSGAAWTEPRNSLDRQRTRSG
jgi:hypothetical protein